MHRDELIRLVSNGVLPLDDSDESLLSQFQSVPPPRGGNLSLIPEAIELLLAAAFGGGQIHVVQFDGGFDIIAGSRQDFFGETFDARRGARLIRAIEELRDAHLIQAFHQNIFHVTDQGYILADEITATRNRDTQV